MSENDDKAIPDQPEDPGIAPDQVDDTGTAPTDELDLSQVELKIKLAELRRIEAEASESEKRLKHWWLHGGVTQTILSAFVGGIIIFGVAIPILFSVVNEYIEYGNLQNKRERLDLVVKADSLKVAADTLSVLADSLNELSLILQQRNKALSGQITRLNTQQDSLVFASKARTSELQASLDTALRSGRNNSDEVAQLRAAVATQQRTSERLAATFTSPATSMEFVRIPAGTFMMGSENGDDDEKPIHQVRVTKPFYMGKFEVTQAQWQAVMGSNPSFFNGGNLPIEQVSWNEAQEFIERLNERESTSSYRLPTEAEWEYACRAGTTGDYAGDLGAMAWYKGNSDRKTHPVETKQANAFGLHDMHGNVWEWVQDWSAPTYDANAPGDDPTGPQSGSSRVFRGGSWGSVAVSCRSADRGSNKPGDRYYGLGFRLVRPAL